MSLTVTDDLIISDRTAHTACPVPGHPDAWQVTWLPGQMISRNGAVTAMVLAEAASWEPRPGHRIWPHVCNWAAELGLSRPAALALASAPQSETNAEKEPASASDREATGP